MKLGFMSSQNTAMTVKFMDKLNANFLLQAAV